MSKALVIKDADFSTNKLAVISYGNVPCTDVSFSSSTIDVTDMSPVQLSYTVTPEDTTDTISFSSSDESVATVSNGVLTPVGIGETTITVSCGNCSDTATVTIAITATPYYAWAAPNATDGLGIYSVKTNWYQMTAFGQGDQASDFELVPTTSDRIANPYAIKIPQNATKVKVSASSYNIFYNGTTSRFVWAKNEASGKSGQPANSIKGISEEGVNLSGGALVKSIPDGADCVNILFRLANAQSEYETKPGDYATENGFKIEFLAE